MAAVAPHSLVVTGGKGGVGKSTVAAGLARTLIAQGRLIGLLDADHSGPSQAVLFNAPDLKVRGGRIIPAIVDGVRVVSIGAFAQPHTPIIWSAPLLAGAFHQLIEETDWGSLDLFIVDMPPRSSEAFLAVRDLLPPAIALCVTTGSPLAAADCLRDISFYRRLGVPLLGIVENMTGIACEECGTIRPLFDPQVVATLARESGAEVVCRLPWSSALEREGCMLALAELCCSRIGL